MWRLIKAEFAYHPVIVWWTLAAFLVPPLLVEALIAIRMVTLTSLMLGQIMTWIIIAPNLPYLTGMLNQISRWENRGKQFFQLTVTARELSLFLPVLFLGGLLLELVMLAVLRALANGAGAPLPWRGVLGCFLIQNAAMAIMDTSVRKKVTFGAGRFLGLWAPFFAAFMLLFEFVLSPVQQGNLQAYSRVGHPAFLIGSLGVVAAALGFHIRRVQHDRSF